jgi:hypothetical protein
LPQSSSDDRPKLTRTPAPPGHAANEFHNKDRCPLPRHRSQRIFAPIRHPPPQPFDHLFMNGQNSRCSRLSYFRLSKT